MSPYHIRYQKNGRKEKIRTSSNKKRESKCRDKQSWRWRRNTTEERLKGKQRGLKFVYLSFHSMFVLALSATVQCQKILAECCSLPQWKENSVTDLTEKTKPKSEKTIKSSLISTVMFFKVLLSSKHLLSYINKAFGDVQGYSELSFLSNLLNYFKHRKNCINSACGSPP